jgi:hypothetical protein
MSRDCVKLSKAAIVNLLKAAPIIERHNLDGLRIVEVGDMRIVESDVSVLADANAGDIQRMLPQ